MAPYLRGLMNADLPCLITKVRSPAGTSVLQSENPCLRWNSGSAVWNWPRRSEIRYAGTKYLKPASEKKLSAFAWPSKKPASRCLQSSSFSKGPTSSYGSHPSKLPCKKTSSRMSVARESALNLLDHDAWVAHADSPMVRRPTVLHYCER